MLAAVELSFRLMGSVFRRSVEAFNRFDLVNAIEFGHMIIRTSGIVGVLILSPSLIGLASVSLLSTMVDVCAIIVLSRHVWPGLRVSASLCSKELMREMAGFGIPAFVDNVSRKIIDKIALIIIGALLSVQLVTMYSIGLMVTNYAWILLIQIVTILTPEIYKMTAKGDNSATRYIYIRASNANAFLCIPVLISCIFFAEDFIRLWMGQEYLESARIMQILSISTLFMVWSYPAGTVILGYGHARLAAVITAIEATVSLILSIVLLKVLNMGIIGAAIGTLIPIVILEGICRPIFACKMMQLPMEQFLFKAGMRWYFAAGLFSGICLLGKTVSITTWTEFIMVIGGLCIIYSPIGWFLLFDVSTRRSLLQPLQRQAHAK
jgi:O-antigen/teichoic acid export membrane protein